MKARFLIFSFLCVLFALPSYSQVPDKHTETPAASADIDFESLSWLAGTWTARDGTKMIEEHWSKLGLSLFGSSRTMEADKSKAIELLLLEKRDDEWLMRLRFFGPAMDKALRGKDAPLLLKLVEADKQHFKCIGIGNEEGTTLIYQLKTPDTLHASISKIREAKEVWREEYVFHRTTQP
jgi:hypothetical protein